MVNNLLVRLDMDLLLWRHAVKDDTHAFSIRVKGRELAFGHRFKLLKVKEAVEVGKCKCARLGSTLKLARCSSFLFGLICRGGNSVILSHLRLLARSGALGLVPYGSRSMLISKLVMATASKYT